MHHLVYADNVKRATRTSYDIAVMARLRYPMPAPVDPDVDEAAREAVWEDRRQFAEEQEEEYENLLSNAYLTAEVGGDGPGRLPDLITSELAGVARQLQLLEEYRDRLIVFARSLASRPVPARTLGSATGVSHSTIVRMATAEAIADVAMEAGPAAADTLQDLDPRDDPEFYLRLQHAVSIARDGDQ